MKEIIQTIQNRIQSNREQKARLEKLYNALISFWTEVNIWHASGIGIGSYSELEYKIGIALDSMDIGTIESSTEEMRKLRLS